MKKNKFLKFFGLVGICFASFTSFTLVNSNSTKSKIQKLKRKFSIKANEIKNSKYFHYNSVGDDEQKITEQELYDHINAFEDKFFYELSAVGFDETNVNTAVGMMKANVNKQIELAKQKVSGTDNEQDWPEIVYSYIDDQADKFGFDVIDFDDFIENEIPYLSAKYETDLCEYGVDKSISEQKALEYRESLLSIVNCAEYYLFDDIDFSLTMLELNSSQRFDANYLKTGIYDKEKAEENLKDAELSTVLEWFKSIASKDVFIPEKNLCAFKDYSQTKTGISLDEAKPYCFSDDEITSVFNYKYSTIRGFDPSIIPYYDIEPTTPGDFDPFIVNSLTITGPLNVFNSGHAIYEKCEILPGYKLNTRLVGIDDTADSHLCKLNFEFGISKTDDSYILWDIDKNEYTYSKAKDPSLFEVKVDDYGLIWTLTNNVYMNEYASIVPELNNLDFDEYGACFSESIDSRTNIDKLMSKYKSNVNETTYNLERNPVILDEEDYAGVTVPQSVQNFVGKTFHTNQKIVLITDDINTNTNILSIHWEVIDTNITDSNKTDNDFFALKNFQWKINGQISKNINIRYNLSKEYLDVINEAEENYQSFKDLKEMIDLSKETCGSYYLSKTEDLLISDTVFLAIASVAAIITSTFCVIYTLQVINSFGFNVDAAISLALGVAYIAITAIMVACSLSNLVNQWKEFNELKEKIEILNPNENYDYITQIYDSCKELHEIIIDPTAQYSIKLDAASKINDIGYNAREHLKDIFDWIVNQDESWSDEQKQEWINTLHLTPDELLEKGLTAAFTISVAIVRKITIGVINSVTSLIPAAAASAMQFIQQTIENSVNELESMAQSFEQAATNAATATDQTLLRNAANFCRSQRLNITNNSLKPAKAQYELTKTEVPTCEAAGAKIKIICQTSTAIGIFSTIIDSVIKVLLPLIIY